MQHNACEGLSGNRVCLGSICKGTPTFGAGSPWSCLKVFRGRGLLELPRGPGSIGVLAWISTQGRGLAWRQEPACGFGWVKPRSVRKAGTFRQDFVARSPEGARRTTEARFSAGRGMGSVIVWSSVHFPIVLVISAESCLTQT